MILLRMALSRGVSGSLAELPAAATAAAASSPLADLLLLLLNCRRVEPSYPNARLLEPWT
jgi:hypothetical protein